MNLVNYTKKNFFNLIIVVSFLFIINEFHKLNQYNKLYLESLKIDTKETIETIEFSHQDLTIKNLESLNIDSKLMFNFVSTQSFSFMRNHDELERLSVKLKKSNLPIEVKIGLLKDLRKQQKQLNKKINILVDKETVFLLSEIKKE